MVRKTIGTKTGRSTAKAKAASSSAAKTVAKSGSGPGKVTTSKGSTLDPAQIAEIAKHLAAMHTSLKATAKTPDQRADVGVVGLAQHHAEQGDPATVGSLLRRLSNWTRDHQDKIRNHIGHAVWEAITKAYLV